jgi:hypothetical protein
MQVPRCPYLYLKHARVIWRMLAKPRRTLYAYVGKIASDSVCLRKVKAYVGKTSWDSVCLCWTNPVGLSMRMMDKSRRNVALHAQRPT